MIQPQIKIHPALPTDASYPEIIAARFENETSDWKFRSPILRQLPESFGIKIAGHYAELYRQEGRRTANLYMLDVKDDLSHFSISLAADDDDLINYAKKAAEHCTRLRYAAKNDEIALYALNHFISNRYRINLPLLNTKNGKSTSVSVPVTVTEDQTINVNVTISVTGILNRLCEEHWWRRTLRNVHKRNVEKHAIRSGYVQRNGNIYVSDETFKSYIQQQKRNMHILEQCYAINELNGDKFNLKELAEHSLANPSNRRAELMVRIRGFEDASKELGHCAMFYTITCPSRMHACITKILPNGKIQVFSNPKYDKTTPKDAQKYLAKIWAQIRAKLKRDGLDIYGFRVTEAHHDGTPHWHLLLFMTPAQEPVITNIIKKYVLRENSTEAGADKHRFKAEKIDPKKGSATGYIAKYITKGLDGFGLDVDLYGEDAKKSAQRVRAWASTWGIRQYQQLGGPPVTIYRELRRLDGKDLEGIMAELWKAADSGDWHNFIKLFGGPNVERKDFIVTVAKKWNDKPNRYQEPSGYQIIGVNFGRVVITTRNYQWTIEYKRKSDAVTYRGVSNGEDDLSRVPICEFFDRGHLAPLEYCQ